MLIANQLLLCLNALEGMIKSTSQQVNQSTGCISRKGQQKPQHI
jgi:hypothetical protein